MEGNSQANGNISQAKKDLIASLIVKNNEANSEDLGIIQVIEAMENNDPTKAIKSKKLSRRNI